MPASAAASRNDPSRTFWKSSWRAFGPDQQQIDVAAVVEVRRDDRQPAAIPPPTFASLVMSVNVPLPLFRSS